MGQCSEEVVNLEAFRSSATLVSLTIASPNSTLRQNPKRRFYMLTASVMKGLMPLSIEYVNNVYRVISAENCSRDERGQSETRLHLQSLSFFHNIENKQHLFSLSATYLRADDFIHPRLLPLQANNENETRMPILE